jgi:hypothetical protein
MKANSPKAGVREIPPHEAFGNPNFKGPSKGPQGAFPKSSSPSQ